MAPLPCDFIYIDASGNTQTITLTDGNPVFICSAVTPIAVDGCEISIVNTGDLCINGFCPPTLTPTSTPTPTPTVTTSCLCYNLYYGTKSGVFFDVTFTDCVLGLTTVTLGSPTNVIVSNLFMCSSTIPITGNTSGGDPTFISLLAGGPCSVSGDCITTPTPTPSSTPTPTPSSTPTPTPTEVPLCDCYFISNGQEGQVLFSYTDCNGNYQTSPVAAGGFAAVCGSNVQTLGLPLTITQNGVCVDNQCPIYCWDVRNTGDTLCEIFYVDSTQNYQTTNVPSGETISICSFIEPIGNISCSGDLQIYQGGLCTNGICPCPYCSEYEFIVSQNDLDSATGNTDPSNDNVVFLDYVPCGLLTQVDLSFNTAGIYGPYCINENFNYYYGYIKDDISILGPDVLVDSVLNKTGCCCDCQYVSFNISQGDLNNFTGNTNPAYPNNTIIFGYADCNGVQRKLYINTAGIYQNYICASVIQNELTAGFNGYQDDSPWLGSFESTFEFSGCCNETNCLCYEAYIGDSDLTFTPCSGITETIAGGGLSVSVCSITFPTSTNPNIVIVVDGACDNNVDCPATTTTTTQPVVIPCECFTMDITITQQDLNSATGNTPGFFYEDHTIYHVFTNCQQEQELVSYTVAGTYLAAACVSSAYTVNSLFYVKGTYNSIILNSYTYNYSDCCNPFLAPINPSSQSIYVFESCCTGEIFAAGPYPGILLDGETYYLTTSGFDGCVIINNSLTPTNNYVGYTATLYADCDNCKLNHPC